MKCVKVPLKKLNDTRRSLMEKNLMNMNYKIKTKNEYGFIAINKNIPGSIFLALIAIMPAFARIFDIPGRASAAGSDP